MTIPSCIRFTSWNKFYCFSLFLLAVIIVAMYFSTYSGLIYSSFKGKIAPVDRPHNKKSARQSSSLNIWKNQTVSLHPDVNVVPSTLPETFVLPQQDCVPLPKSPKEGVVICVHPGNVDVARTKTLKSGILHEASLVVQAGEYLERFPDMVFVDIGSNIGVYTLFVAAMGRKVLAVEMLPRNVQHTQVALRISGLGPEVTIVNNGLYFDHRVINVEIHKINIGATELKNANPATDSEKLDVQTICMDDLIPLLKGARAFVKMDIENSENYALRGARKFFQKVNVQAVQMEWLRSREKSKSLEILSFMNSSGYVLSRSINQYLPVDENKLVGDFFFLKLEKKN